MSSSPTRTCPHYPAARSSGVDPGSTGGEVMFLGRERRVASRRRSWVLFEHTGSTLSREE